MEPSDLNLDKPEDSEADLRSLVTTLTQTVDKVSNNVDVMVTESSAMRKAYERKTDALIRSRKENWILRSILAACLAIILGGALIVWRDHVEESCVKKWGVASADRSKALNQPGADRVTDLYGALGAASGGALKGVIRLPPRAEQVDFIFAAKKRYPLLVPGTKADITKESAAQLSSSYYLIVGLDVNNVYVDEAAAHPVPDSPFNCSAF